MLVVYTFTHNNIRICVELYTYCALHFSIVYLA